MVFVVIVSKYYVAATIYLYDHHYDQKHEQQ